MRVNMGREGRTSSSLSANGGTMLGSLILANGPSQPLEAATKYYVDTAFANLNANNVVDGVLPISSLPGFTGDATSNQGSNTITLANLGVNPGSYAKVIVDSKGRVTGNDVLSSSDLPVVNWSKIQNEPTTVEGYGITDALTTAGGTFTGNLSVGAPTQSLSAVNKQYVDSALTGNSAVVGDIIRKPYATTPAGFLRCNGGLVSKTTYADLYAVIGDNFANNSVKGSGKPWTQQYQINNTRSSDITGWVTATNFPKMVGQAQTVVTKNRVYFIGGYSTTASPSYQSEVYYAVINSDGTLGTWIATTSLPYGISMSEAVTLKNRVYLFGGSNGLGTKFILSAIINSDGSLGNWENVGTLPVVVTESCAIITIGRVYLLGGTSSGNIYTTTINSDGTLGVWSNVGTLPVTLARSQAIVTKNRIYLVGGYNGTNYVSTIYTAVINNDGTLGSWISSGNIPAAICGAQAIVKNDRVFLLGGMSGGSNYVSTVYTAPINIDGTLGTWAAGTSLPSVVGFSQAVVTNSRIYLIGGNNNSGNIATVYVASFLGGKNDYSEYYTDSITPNYMMPGSGKPWQQQYQINTTQSTDITGWTASVALIDKLERSQVVVTKNRVYLLGGETGGSNTSNIYTAPINSDGTLGTWTQNGTLPSSLAASQAIITKNRVYLLGGTIGSPSSIVYTAPINADGTLGTWVTDSNSLPSDLSNSSVALTKNRVYLLGGSTPGIVSTVYTAPINADGILGTWTTGISLPVALQHAQVIITKNRIYLCGGGDPAPQSTVYVAQIFNDGTIGNWSTDVSLPGPIIKSQAIVTNNRVYLLGGWGSAGYSSTVYTAPINSDGTLGAWITGTSLPSTVAWGQAFVAANNIYLLGGTTGTTLSTVYRAPFLGSSNDYSSYYDGSISPLEPIDQTTLFALPDFSAREKNGVNFYIKF